MSALLQSQSIRSSSKKKHEEEQENRCNEEWQGK